MWELLGKGGTRGGAGDLDGDGRAEIWYWLSGDGPRADDPNATVKRLVGMGHDGEPVELALWERFSPTKRSFGDLDNDGLLDLVGIGAQSPDVRSPPSVALSQTVAGAMPDRLWTLVDKLGGLDWRIADLQADGRPELIFDSTTTRIFEYAGEGRMRPHPVYEHSPFGPNRDRRPPVPSGVGLNVGDFDEDGRTEVGYMLSRLNQGVADTLRIIEPDADGRYVVTWEEPLALSHLALAAEGDLDGDGRLEILRGGKGLNAVTMQACWWFGLLGADGDDLYSLRADHWYFGGGFPDQGDADMGDTDGDGDDEVIVSRGDHVTVFDFEKTSDKFVPVLDVDAWNTGDFMLEVAAADIDGDGRDEVVVFAGRYETAIGPEESVAVRVYRRRP